ncbi:MAG TPA: TonB-dependent receptor [Lunatimonas sp.]|nr:TonB-dependent receptor [Lunatimonas sp.]
MKINLQKFFLAALPLLLLLHLQAVAQDRVISGTVSSPQGEGLPGVSILAKGTNIGTVSDLDGNYSISVPGANATLIFSYIGYETRELETNNRTTVDLVLAEDSQNLQEVVVIGYTTKQVTELSSSVNVVSGEKLRDVTSNNVADLLQGKAPGVIVSRPSGNPNAAPNVVIRGSSSITAGSAPLYVVDGIIGGTANPNDVESVTVLKDAAATGLYGSRAANGVIIMTTKSGKAGETKVSMNLSSGFNTATMGNFDVFDSQQLYDYQRTFWDPATWDRDRPSSLLQQNTDWLGLAFRTAYTQNHSMSISGGSEKTQVYFSGNFFNEEGTIHHSGNKVYNFRTNISHKLNEKLKLTLRLNGRFRNTEDEASGNYGALVLGTRNMPWDNPYNADGTIRMGTEEGWIGRENDNFLHGWQYNFDRSREAALSGDVVLDYFITDNLSFSTNNRVSYSNGKRELYYDVRSKAGRGLGTLNNDFMYNTMLITSNRLHYDKSFDNHNFSAIAVAEAEKNLTDNNSMLGQGIPAGLHVMNTASQILRSTTGSGPGFATEHAFTKGLVQVDYNYDQRYFVVASFINESSSRFGSNNRSANFYTLGTSWILSNEEFMQHNSQFDLLKVRASFGSTGNAQIGDYQTRGLYGFSSQYNGFPASVPTQLANDNLTWEKANTVNLGLDVGMFKRVFLNVDVYDKTTDALLLNVQKPYTSGFTSVIENVGSVRNRGLEINLTTDNLNGEFKWETNFNIAFNRNEVLLLDEGKDIVTGSRIIRVGEDMNSWYMRKWAGVDPDNGDPLWEVVNTGADGERVVSTTNQLNNATLQIVGTFTPNFTGGFSNTFSYKAFSLNTFFNFVSGNQVYNASRVTFDSDGAYETANNMVPMSDWSRWQQPGDIATHPRAVFGGNLNSNRESSRYLEDGSYIRLRNVRLSYRLPQSLLSRISISNSNVFLSGDNLWTGTRFSGMDPETSLGPGGGISSGRYPISRRILFGINLSL